MKLAETVTFGGAGLDRAAELRGDAGALAAALADGRGTVLPIWRGKPLMQADDAGQRLVWLPADHPMLADAPGERLFLGNDDGALRFAADLARWAPEAAAYAPLDSFADDSLQVHPTADAGQVFRELRLAMTMLTPRDAELAATAKAMLGWHRSHRFCARCGSESRVAQAGWQRLCPDCGAHHFPRTDPVVIMLITHGNDVLLGRSPGWPAGMYSLLAGFVEPGETIEAAVRREVAEETAVKVGPVDYLASQPWPYPSSLMFGCWGQAQSRAITIDPVELEGAFWMSREDLAEAMAGRHPTLLPARRGAIAHFLLENWLADRLD
ncbi:NAD(+) diphosphatase [Rhodobacteraceae bacterium W635]|uniref:NAD(+) diphosphatase n=1 Tax=Nioella halotolerans TaxID=2303578 RepID=UPI000E3EB8A0|nr:NAD(+) diphosphatase [Rhodobacteraceae bacterium W635]